MELQMVGSGAADVMPGLWLWWWWWWRVGAAGRRGDDCLTSFLILSGECLESIADCDDFVLV